MKKHPLQLALESGEQVELIEVPQSEFIVGEIYSDLPILAYRTTLLRYEKIDPQKKLIHFSYVAGSRSYCSSEDGLISFPISAVIHLYKLSTSLSVITEKHPLVVAFREGIDRELVPVNPKDLVVGEIYCTLPIFHFLATLLEYAGKGPFRSSRFKYVAGANPYRERDGFIHFGNAEEFYKLKENLNP